jgi:hypothetical protein
VRRRRRSSRRGLLPSADRTVGHARSLVRGRTRGRSFHSVSVSPSSP